MYYIVVSEYIPSILRMIYIVYAHSEVNKYL